MKRNTNRHSFVLKSSIAAALMLAAVSSPTWAQNAVCVDPAAGPDTQVVTGTNAVACGANATGSQAGAVAIGSGANAIGPSAANTIFASVAVGFNANAQDNGVAIGNTAIANFSATATPNATGINSAVAAGAGAVAVGANTVAIGTTSRAGTGFAFNTPGAVVNAGSNITAVGGRAEVNANGGTALGANSNVSGANGIAVGQNALTTGVDAVAIGSGATATAANSMALGANSNTGARVNTVSVGSIGAERQVTNVAAGTVGTDAVNLNQMGSADAAVLASANSYTNSQIAAIVISVAGFDDIFDGIDKRIDQVGAMSSALAQMTAAASSGSGEKNNSLAVGIGNYGGKTAFAVGFQRNVTDAVTVNFGLAFDGDKTATGAGAAYHW